MRGRGPLKCVSLEHVLVDQLGRDGAMLGRKKWLVEHKDSSLVYCTFSHQIRHPLVRRSDEDGYFQLSRWSPLLI